MDKDIKGLLDKLTLEEKASLCSGSDFWHTEGIERLDIPSIMVTDGPHGLRKQGGESDHVGLSESVKATCFPTASATASSWDVDLLHEMGLALGEECLQEEVSVLLGPGANIKRSPLCGRNFEYISEDPYLTGEIGTALVKGIQSKGIGTSLKHFAVNNQEYRRMATESVVDERTLREIYLSGFEAVVKESQPWTLMCAYNKVDSVYCSDNKKLLTDILKEEWGHTGLVMTDWGAMNDRVLGIKAGLELEMPSSGGLNDARIVEAVKAGILSEADLDKAVTRLLELILKSSESLKPGYKYDSDEHNDLARRVAANSAVLLKNDESILPLSKDDKIAVIGEFARSPRYQGAGSSLIQPIKITSIVDELKAQKISHGFSQGYSVKTDEVDDHLIAAAVEKAKKYDTAVVVVGLTDDYESEGFDRTHLSMPKNHRALVEAVAQVNENVIVVLQNGAPIEIPWLKDVKAVLECYLGGQASGGGAVDLLFGDVNPSGKLAETFPISLEDDLASNWFGMGPKTVEYRESIYVGYRYYDTANAPVQFPFGYGLSYTEFEYSDIQISHDTIVDTQEVEVSFKVKNIGSVYGSEVVQLYVKDIESTIFRPEKELKGFAKVHLQPGEETQVHLSLDQRAFAYYNTSISDWHVESGEFSIQVGASSRDIKLQTQIQVTSSMSEVTVPDYRQIAPEYYEIGSGQKDFSDKSFEALLKRKIPTNMVDENELFTINSTLEDVCVTFVGRQLHKMITKNFMKMVGDEDANESTVRMMKSVVNDMPVRSMVLMGGGQFNFKMADGLLQMMNGQFIRGLVKVIKGRK